MVLVRIQHKQIAEKFRMGQTIFCQGTAPGPSLISGARSTAARLVLLVQPGEGHFL